MLRRKGFTLIELLVVIAIIGILATIALSATQSARKRAADTKIKSDVQSVLKAWITHSSDSATFLQAANGAAAPANLTLQATNAQAMANTFITNGDLRSGFTVGGITIASDPDVAPPYAVSNIQGQAIAVGAPLTANPTEVLSSGIYVATRAPVGGNAAHNFAAPGVLPYFGATQQ